MILDKEATTEAISQSNHLAQTNFPFDSISCALQDLTNALHRHIAFLDVLYMWPTQKEQLSLPPVDKTARFSNLERKASLLRNAGLW